ncbi:MAG: rhomboid family intramembrane serine protease, partial [Chloroflexi bacterium]|nr:rhomboid family intramembrane serine protease [Chloroflexota bacterium]
RPEFFISMFGLQPAGFIERPWTIITNMFIHAPFPSIWHIFGNMLTLYFFGGYLIRLIGERNVFIIYFLGGILGNIFFMLWASPFSRAIGASGAIFAVAGALTVLIPKEKVIIFPLPVPIPLWVAVIGGFLIISPGIAWQAHLGGLLFGVVIAYFFFRRKQLRLL